MAEGMQDHIARGIMAGLCLLWLVLGILAIDDSVPKGLLLMGNGIAFGLFVFACNSKKRIIRIFLYVFISANIILVFLDGIGIADWAALVLYAVLVSFLIKGGKKD